MAGGLLDTLKTHTPYHPHSDIRCPWQTHFRGAHRQGRGAAGLLTNPSSSVRFKGIDSHDIRIGMRWNFSDPSCCGPVEKPVAYAPAPTVRKY